MGCGRSKTFVVQDNKNVVPPPSHKKDDSCTINVEETPEINVFIDTDNSEANCVNLCANAKPRLVHSGVRRNTQDSEIKPVVNEAFIPDTDDKQIEHSSNSRNIPSNVSRNSDSGLGNASSISANSDRPKSSLPNTPYKFRTRSKTPSSSVKQLDNTYRPDSAQAGSIITTSALNASFMTTDDENVDVTLDLHTPFSEYTECEETSLSFRTSSNTPSTTATSVEPLPTIMPTKHFGVIREESEGGFTPRSIDCTDERKKETGIQNGILPQYLPREVLSHNTKAGFRDWLVYKKKVYETNLVISIFAPLVQEHVESKRRENKKLKEDIDQKVKEMRMNNDQKVKEMTMNNASNTEIDDDSDDESFISWNSSLDEAQEEYDTNEKCIKNAERFENRSLWNSLGIETLLRLDFGTDVINENLPMCCVGETVQPNSARYWDDVRGDVRMLLDQLNRADARDQLKVTEREYKEQLQDWLRQYHDRNPDMSQVPDGDPNRFSFPLPIRFQGNAKEFRLWLEQWIQFDCEVPDGGAWWRYEVEDIDLGNPDEIFKATLRSDNENFHPFNHDIEGKTAWRVLPEKVVADDIMTANQKAVEESRRHRTDLDDPKRMERRRKTLLKYFIRKYEMRPSAVEHFTQWASAMEEGDRKFKNLCGLV